MTINAEQQICNEAMIGNDPHAQAEFARGRAAAADRATGEHAAAILDMSPRQLQRHEEQGLKLTRKKLGKQLFYSRTDMVALKGRLPKKWTRSKLTKMS